MPPRGKGANAKVVNLEEDLLADVVVLALRHEVRSNGDEYVLTIAEEVVVEGLKSGRPARGLLKTCSLLRSSLTRMKKALPLQRRHP